MTLHSNGLFCVWTASGCIDYLLDSLLRLPCQTQKRSFSVRRFILVGTLNTNDRNSKPPVLCFFKMGRSPMFLSLKNSDLEFVSYFAFRYSDFTLRLQAILARSFKGPCDADSIECCCPITLRHVQDESGREWPAPPGPRAPWQCPVPVSEPLPWAPSRTGRCTPCPRYR